MYLKGNIANKYSFLIIPKIYFVNYYYAGKTNFSFSSESQRKFELWDVLELLLKTNKHEQWTLYLQIHPSLSAQQQNL